MPRVFRVRLPLELYGGWFWGWKGLVTFLEACGITYLKSYADSVYTGQFGGK